MRLLLAYVSNLVILMQGSATVTKPKLPVLQLVAFGEDHLLDLSDADVQMDVIETKRAVCSRHVNKYADNGLIVFNQWRATLRLLKLPLPRGWATYWRTLEGSVHLNTVSLTLL